MPFLSEADRSSLLELARRTVTQVVASQKLPEKAPREGVFAEKRGVFVTLHALGRLRGCIGVVEPYQPLGEALVHCAACAALQDPRFSPVRAEELAELHIEISLLSVVEPIHPEKVEIGKHGLLICQGAQRGLLLPQVAVEHQLSREEFLAETCRKAGLPLNAWREMETQIFAFTCEVFAEAPQMG